MNAYDFASRASRLLLLLLMGAATGCAADTAAPPPFQQTSALPASRPAGRVAIALDIDETLAITDYLTLVTGIGRDDSKPYTGALDVIAENRERFDFIYLTSRPQSLFVETREWLSNMGFPPGPVLTSARYVDVFYPLGFKSRMLAAFREGTPNLMIGIGDKVTDSQAYAVNNMLPLIVNPTRRSFHEKTLRFDDWAALGRFLREHRDVLSDPHRLAEAYGVGGPSPHPRTFRTQVALSPWLPLEMLFLIPASAGEWVARTEMADAQRKARRALDTVAFPLDEAIRTFETERPQHRLLRIQLVSENGRPEYILHYAERQQLRRAAMDGRDRAIRELGPVFRLHDDMQEAADQARISFHDAMRIAARELDGRVYEAELEIDDRKAIYELSTMVLGRFYEIEIDAQTGEVVEVEDETAISTP